jgi:tRNA U34 5-methylaminomethyl-2-thiouridine-forming methyltransferase MnmC
MGAGVQVKFTEDGSHTLFSERFGECYHSSHGAIQESMHVFINSGLACASSPSPSILEVGFGTGLNALLSLIYGEENNLPITYSAIELYPLKPAVIQQINYPDILGFAEEYRLLHDVEWGESHNITGNFKLKKLEDDLSVVHLNDLYDLVYYDAFSPEIQPELWKARIFEKVAKVCNPGAVLTTYSAKGAVRRALQASGFAVERIPGPPGKREIIRAKKL